MEEGLSPASRRPRRGRPPSSSRRPAALLICDISGFTSLTERPESLGREGAEEVAELAGQVFGAACGAIARWQGAIVSFGGDAVFATFAGRSRVGRALAAAREVGRAVPRSFATSAGRRRIELASAVHHGAVDELLLGSPARPVRLVTGPAVVELARIEARARRGEVVTSAAARRQLATEPGATAASGRRRRISPSVASSYVPPPRGSLRAFEGAFRHVAVLFVESELPEARTLPRMERLLRLLEQVLEECGGTLVKWDLSPAGTRWLCVFGVPAAQEDPARRAAHAARALLASAPRGVPLRAGIATGAVACILLGSGADTRVDVMGDVVNTAARICAAARFGEALLTGAARRLAGSAGFRAAGARRLKGKARSLPLHALAELPASRGTPAPDTPLPLAGRDRELATLAAALDAARAGRGASFAIDGDAGAGKSRLAMECVARARALGFACLEARAAPYGGRHLAVAASLLRSALGLAEEASAGLLRARIRRDVERLGLPPLVGHHLEEIAGARSAGSPCAGLDGRTLRTNNRSALVAYVRALAALRPQLLVVDDAHRADPGSRDLLSWLSSRASGSRVVLLVLQRAGEPPAGATLLPLAPLDETAAREILGHLLPGASEAVARAAIERAGGNPFYLQELARHVRASREVEARGSLPESVEALLAARIDLLTPAARRVVQAASVLGRELEPRHLAAIAAPRRGLRRSLEELAAAGILRRRTRSGPTLSFPSALVQESAYAGILASRRRELHREAARALAAERGPSRRDAALGHHWERAGERARARAAYARAAAQAVASHASDDAARHHEAALALQRHPSLASARTRVALGSALFVLGKLEASLEQYERAGEEIAALDGRRPPPSAARRPAPTELAADVLHGAASAELRLGRQEAARRHYREAARLWRREGDPREGVVIGDLATHFFERGDMKGALRHSRRALAIIGGHRVEGAGVVIGNLGNALAMLGRTDEALATYRRALRHHRRQRDLRLEGHVQGNVAGLMHMQGRHAAARRRYERALVVARAVCDRRFESHLLGQMAVLLQQAGALGEAEQLLEQSLVICRETGEQRAEGVLHCNLASLHVAQGQLGRATAAARRTIAICRQVGERRYEAGGLRQLAAVAAARGRLRRARVLYESCLRVFRELGLEHDVREVELLMEELRDDAPSLAPRRPRDASVFPGSTRAARTT